MNILYFAWVKSRVGVGQETVAPPADVTTVGSLMTWLAGQSAGHAAAFANPAVIRAAVNQEHAPFEATIRAGDEIAFFPPVTGG
jgi:molybdopterin synthase sulfur carrier subunit